MCFPRLPDWPFFGRISKIWLRFKLVGLQKSSAGLLAFCWSNLKLFDPKKFVWLFGSSLTFLH